MALDPNKLVFFYPEGLIRFKKHLFDRVAITCGGVIRGSIEDLERLELPYIPVVGCTLGLRYLIDRWEAEGRDWIYWDRGYLRRVFWATQIEGMTWHTGYYRWHLRSFQMKEVKLVPADRWISLDVPVRAWRKCPNGYIVVAAPPPNYAQFHSIEGWVDETIAELRRYSDREIIVRHKNENMPLKDQLSGAFVLVTHGSIAAIESLVLGTPVVVHPISAAASVGRTRLEDVEDPIYPDRMPWLRALAYNQWSDPEMQDGTLWKQLGDYDGL